MFFYPVEIAEDSFATIARSKFRKVAYQISHKFKLQFRAIDPTNRRGYFARHSAGSDNGDAPHAHWIFPFFAGLTPRNSRMVACPSSEMPSRLRAFHTVRKIILRSSQKDRLSTYQTSYANF